MPTIVAYQPTVQLLAEQFAALDERCRPLSDLQWATPSCLPGWSVQDNLSHVIGTESMLAGDRAPEADEPADDDRPAHVRNAIGEANEQWVAALRQLDGPAVLDRFVDVTGRRLAALRAMDQADFDAPSWTPAGPDETYGRFMRIRHFDCYMHEHDIAATLGLPERADADHVASCLDEVATGLGFIVGKRAGMPAGQRVRIDLHGPVERRYLVEVGDRAAVVEALSGPPTVSLELDAMLFLRLTGGRSDAAPRIADEVGLGGDPALAQQLANRLAFTI